MTAAITRFELQPRRWYACEFIGDAFELDLCSYSPIKVTEIEPLKTGKSTLALHFYHANYPEGVRDKIYKIRVIERGEHYMLAKSLDHQTARYLQIYEISSDWVTRHFPSMEPDRNDIQTWLTENI